MGDALSNPSGSIDSAMYESVPELNWNKWILHGYGLIILLAAIYFLITSIWTMEYSGLVLFALLILYLLLIVYVMRVWRRPIRITETALLVPTGRYVFRRNGDVIVVPIHDVAGIGLVFTLSREPGWRLNVWTEDGTRHETTIVWSTRWYFSWNSKWYSTGRRGPAKVSSCTNDIDPVTGVDRPALQRSQAAIVAKELYSRVLASQGPEGPLATLSLQKHPAAAGRHNGYPVTVWWSPPDGELGYPDQQS